MKQFNIKRFGRLLRWYLCENQRNLTAWTVGLTVAFTLIHAFFTWALGYSEVKDFGESMRPTLMATNVCLFAITVIILYIASSIFTTLKTKQQRIAFFTLPASELEHYLVAAIYVLIVWPLCVNLAFLLGDVLRASLFMLMGYEWDLGINLSKQVYNTFGSRGAFFPWFLSLFVVAGTWLRRHSFAVGMLITVVFSFFLSKAHRFFCPPDASEAVREGWTWFWNLFYLAFTIFNYWLSYRLYKRFQIITSKYTNV